MYAPIQVVLVISTNFLAQSTLDKLWSPVSPQHLWRSTTHTRSTTSTLRYFMPFPVNNLRWCWSPRWPQDTSSMRSMSTSVSGNQSHICCGNRFQHITWWWIRVLSALQVNVILPILSHVLCVPHNNSLAGTFAGTIFQQTWVRKHKMSDHSWSLAWWYR